MKNIGFNLFKIHFYLVLFLFLIHINCAAFCLYAIKPAKAPPPRLPSEILHFHYIVTNTIRRLHSDRHAQFNQKKVSVCLLYVSSLESYGYILCYTGAIWRISYTLRISPKRWWQVLCLYSDEEQVMWQIIRFTKE